MSHTTEINTVTVRDISALHSAVDALRRTGIDISLVTNEVPRMYYSNQHKACPYVVKLGNSRYDIGFDNSENPQVYKPVMDLWGGDIAGEVGASCPMPNTDEGKAQHSIGLLMQKYTEIAVQNAARAQGHQVERVFTDNAGNVQVVLQCA